jgi:hypothetical protein
MREWAAVGCWPRPIRVKQRGKQPKKKRKKRKKKIFELI